MKLRPLALLEPPLPGLGEGNAAKLRWVVGLRWVALAAQALSIVPGLHFGLLEPRLLPPFAGVVCALALINLATRARLARGAEVSQREILLQLTADVIALGALLALTGGAWNPLVPLLFFHAGLGALLLEGRVSVAFLWILIASLIGIQLFSHVPPGLRRARLGLDPVVLFPAQLLVSTSFWLLSRWLSRMLNSMQRHFSALHERQGRIDRLAAIGALAAGLSHELATPLNTAMLALERVGRKHRLEDTPELRDASEALDRCEDVLRHMAGAQLRPEGLELERVDLADLVARVCASAAASGDGLKLSFRNAGRAPANALLPAIPFTQALLNLIENAQEASPAGAAELEVELRAERDGIALEVRDRGEGWPDVVRAHLGEPFITTRAGGVGLGLYYVWTLMSALGGELTLEDRPGGGATARLRLPASGTTQEGVV
jgi:two-component system sensor histidine kinase RegB